LSLFSAAAAGKTPWRLTFSWGNGIPFFVTGQSLPEADLEICDAAAAATPRICIDQGVLARNLERLADYTGRHGLKLRPHAKTHKSLAIARMQLALGAAGLTVAKPGEAEVFAAACDDLLLAYPVVGALQADCAAALAGRLDLKVAVDSSFAVAVLSDAAARAGTTVGILVDLDVGLHRTGVQGPRAALELAQAVERAPGVDLRGMFCYPGHIWEAPNDQAPALRAVADLLQETLDLWRAHGLSAEIVSGGSTPTAYQSHLIEQLTEIRPGTYPFNDMNTVLGGYAAIEDCAARIVATVVSDAVPGQVVVDAGSKTLAADRCISGPESGHGYIVEYPEAKIAKLNEEHGQVDVSRCAQRPRIGERVTIIPNHICPCINLQERAWMKSTDGNWSPLTIEARGKVT
jgi:D-serine deaminase-like pyridoxal phosphate-dependent protein